MTTSGSAQRSLHTVAITGASGLVGGNLAVLLAAQNVNVRATKRSSSRVDHLGDVDIDWHEAGLEDRDVPAMTQAFTGCDVVFHCAAVPTQTRKLDGPHRHANANGTRNVIEAARKAGVKRFVHTSSVVTCAIAKRGERDVVESDAWNFPEHGLDDVYAVTKREAEEAALAANEPGAFDVVVVNPATMFGPYDAKPSTGRLIRALQQGRIVGSTSGSCNFVDVRDVCRGMIAAARLGKPGERYILGGENMHYGDIFKLVCEELGRPAPRIALPDVVVSLAGRAGDLVERITGKEQDLNSAISAYSICEGYRFSSEKARRELGYTTSPLRTAVRDAIAWFRSRGML